MDESSAGARCMANIMSATVQKNTTINVAAGGKGTDELVDKIYHINVSGENNVLHFA